MDYLRDMSLADWSIALFFWMSIGWFLIFVFHLSDVGMSIILIKHKGYKKLALANKILVLLLWPIAGWVTSLIVVGIMKKEGIPIPPKDEEIKMRAVTLLFYAAFIFVFKNLIFH